MTYGTVKMGRSGHEAMVLVCDNCGRVLDGVGVPAQEIYQAGGLHFCSEVCLTGLKKSVCGFIETAL